METWNTDDVCHVNVRCGDGKTYTLLQGEISRTVIPYGWKTQVEFSYCAAASESARGNS